MMITRVLTHLAKNLTLILVLTFASSSMLLSQVSYSCQCKETLPSGVIEFKIRAFGPVGTPWEVENAVNLYFDADLTMPIPDMTMIADPLNDGTYCLNGFAADGITPTIDVLDGMNAALPLQMLTCRTPDVEIRPSEPDPAVVCVGSVREFCIENLYGSLVNITWSAPTSISLTQTNNNSCANIEYDTPGSHIIMVEGETTTGCEFSDQIIFIVEDVGASMDLTGACDIYTCTGELDQNYTLSGTDGQDASFKLYTQTASGGLGNLVSMTPGTGSGTSSIVTANPITFPVVAADYVLVACNASTDVTTCDFAVRKTISVKTALDYVNILGPSCTCLEIAHEYSIENSSDYTNINWSISPGVAGTDWIMSPATGSSDIVYVTYLSEGTYTLNSTGLADAGEHSGCTFASTYSVEVTELQQGTIACNNSVNVSLNNNCELDITPDMILEGNHLCNDAYNLVITEADGTLVAGTITQDLLGQTLTVSVEQVCGNNSCWGNLTVEDKSITPITCPTGSQTPFCYEVDDFSDFFAISGLPNFDADVTANYRAATDDWLVSGHDNCSDVILAYEDTSNSDDCAAIRNLLRTWTITDVTNGASNSCSVNLEVISLMSSAIDWPKNWDSALDQDIEKNCPSLDACNVANPIELGCATYTLDTDGNPHPDCTGRPTGLLCSNLQIIGYDDTVLPVCSPAKKILRNWTVWDECALVESKHTQIITLMNLDNPVCIAPQDIAFSSSTHSCEGPVTIPPPIVTGGCLPLTYTVSYNYARGDFNLNNFITTGVSTAASEITEPIIIENIDFTNDSLWVRYIITDECGNTIPTSGCIIEASLNDTQQPIPACDLNNVVALNETGCAYAGPSTFDDNSWDNCGIYQTVIQRMDQSNCNDACGSEGDCQLRQFNFMTYLGEFKGHYYYMSDENVLSQYANAFANALGEDNEGNLDGSLVALDSIGENTWLEDQVGIYTLDAYHTAESHAAYLTNTGGVGGFPGQNFLGRYIVEFDTRCGWTQRESFCCNDCGEETMMMLRVIDNYGNHNFCMVNVKVEDYLPPSIECPEAVINLDCDAVIDFNNLNYGVPTVSDNCSATLVEETGPYTDPRTPQNCFSGSITKTWKAVDKSGLSSNSCTQTIRFTSDDPFTRDDIVWPEDATVTNGCSLFDLDPLSLVEAAQGPTWTSKACSNVVSNFDDQVFTIVDGACQKMVRTWSVVDWCNPSVIHKYDQVIKLVSSDNPIVNCPSQPVYTNAGICISNVTGLEATLNAASCTSNLSWSYTVELASGTITNGSGSIADAIYPDGVHTITYSVTDACDNTGSCTTTITVTDNDPPTPYCHGSLVVPVGSNASVEIWASDIDLGSYDLCSGEVFLSFEPDAIVANLSFDCDNIGSNNVTLYVSDALGNRSSCTSTIYIQDNLNVCTGPRPFASIQGLIMTEDSRMVDDVEVNLMMNNENNPQIDMAEEGTYAFNQLPMYNDYQVLAIKDDSYLNGVSTLDLIMIQRHILGLEQLDSPYKVIAADINSSQKIDGLDLIELRKLILGIYTELPQNDSWRFVNTEQEFATPMAPWPFAEDVSVLNFSNDINDADFVGVKIGDVNLSALANPFNGSVTGRNNSTYELLINKVVTEKGNSRVQFVASEAMTIHGTQMNFDFSSDELLATVPMALEIADHNISWDSVDEGTFRMSWNNTNGIAIEKGDILMEFLFAGETVDLNMNSDLASEVYLEETGTIEALPIVMSENKSSILSEFTVDQNSPNPFKEMTTINFNLPQSGLVNLVLTNVDGRILSRIEGNYAAGNNQIILSSDDIQTTGVVYYQLSFGNMKTTRKMIVLK